MKDIYRKVHLGFFRKPLIEVDSNGFFYDGKIYSLSDVKEVRLVGGNGSPKMLGIDLSDGKKILVNSGALELNGKKYRNGFTSGTNDAFEKLTSYFLMKNVGS
jgi:hypothetical protein